MVAVNMQVRMLHAPYVRSFDGFDRPWNHLEQLVEASTSTRRRSAAGTSLPAGCLVPQDSGSDGRRLVPSMPGGPPLPRPGATDQHASSRAGRTAAARDAHPVIGPHLVHRCARDRAGQPELAARRHDAVAGGDDHRGRDIQLADATRPS
jgi:hypothetical protein